MSGEHDTSFVVEQEILACLPHLRAFARSLTGDRDRADDLVQDAVLRALGAAQQFTPGTNFKAWIFTILRNLYFNEFRRNPSLFRPLEAADIEMHATLPAQQAGLEFDDFRRAFAMLPAEQREALVLVGADGTPKQVKIAHSSGFVLLDRAALETVRERWRFVPAMRAGAAIESWVTVPIRFALTEADAVQ